MATLVLRGVKGTALTFAEADANFTNLNNDKLESASYTAADVLTKIKTVDGTGSGLDADTVDGNHAADFALVAGTTFTGAVDMDGVLNFSTDASRITGNWSDVDRTKRTFFYTNVADSATNVGISPNGTSLIAALTVYNNSSVLSDSTPDLAFGQLTVSDTEVAIKEGSVGNGPDVPMNFHVAGAVRMTISTAGDVSVSGDQIGINTSQTPASANATGTAGTICWDSNYIYVCVATNTWKRAAISWT